MYNPSLKTEAGGREIQRIHLYHDDGRGEKKKEKSAFIALNPSLLYCENVSIYITDGTASLGSTR